MRTNSRKRSTAEDVKSANESTFLSGATAQEDNTQDETSKEVPQTVTTVVTKRRPTKIEWIQPRDQLNLDKKGSRDEPSDRVLVQERPVPATHKYNYYAAQNCKEGYKEYAKAKNAKRLKTFQTKKREQETLCDNQYYFRIHNCGIG